MIPSLREAIFRRIPPAIYSFFPPGRDSPAGTPVRHPERALAPAREPAQNYIAPSTPAVAVAPRPTVDLRPYLQPQLGDRSLEVTDVPQGQVVTMAGVPVVKKNLRELHG